MTASVSEKIQSPAKQKEVAAEQMTDLTVENDRLRNRISTQDAQIKEIEDLKRQNAELKAQIAAQQVASKNKDEALERH